MGLISSLITLPLAPMRGTMRVADMLQRQAENELSDESALRAALVELDAARATGVFSEEEIEDAENALIEQLLALRGVTEAAGGFPE